MPPGVALSYETSDEVDFIIVRWMAPIGKEVDGC